MKMLIWIALIVMGIFIGITYQEQIMDTLNLRHMENIQDSLEDASDSLKSNADSLSDTVSNLAQ